MAGQPALGNLEVCLAQKANMEAIFHSVADGILTVDLDGTITNMNRAMQRLLCAEPAEAIGRPIGEICPCKLWDQRK